MNELIQGILIALLPALLVSIITAYITVRLSIKQFYSQRWWDKKAEAYSQILEHLSYLRYYYEKWSNVIMQPDITLDVDHKKNLDEGYRRSEEAITKAAAVGEFIVTETTTKAISKLLSELFSLTFQSDLIKAIDDSYAAVNECIKTVRGEAKEALLRIMR
jgi:hypothetical protein